MAPAPSLRITLPSTIKTVKGPIDDPEELLYDAAPIDPRTQAVEALSEPLELCWSYVATLSHKLLVCNEITLATVSAVIPAQLRPEGIPSHCETIDIRNIYEEAKASIERLEAAFEARRVPFIVARMQAAAEAAKDELVRVTVKAGNFAKLMIELNYELHQDGLLIEYENPEHADWVHRARVIRARAMFQINDDDYDMLEDGLATFGGGDGAELQAATDDVVEPQEDIYNDFWDGILDSYDVANTAVLSPMWPVLDSPLEAFPALPTPQATPGECTDIFQSKEEIDRAQAWRPCRTVVPGMDVPHDWAAHYSDDIAASPFSPADDTWADSFPTDFDRVPAADDTWRSSRPTDFTTPREPARARPSNGERHWASFSTVGEIPFYSQHFAAEMVPWLDGPMSSSPQTYMENEPLWPAPVVMDEAAASRHYSVAAWALTTRPNRCALFDKTGRCNHCGSTWERQFRSAEPQWKEEGFVVEYPPSKLRAFDDSDVEAVTEDAPQSDFANCLSQWVRTRAMRATTWDLAADYLPFDNSDDLLITDIGIEARIHFEEVPVTGNSTSDGSHSLYVTLVVEGYGHAHIEVHDYTRADDQNLIEPLEELYHGLTFDSPLPSETDESDIEDGLFTLDLFDVDDEDDEELSDLVADPEAAFAVHDEELFDIAAEPEVVFGGLLTTKQMSRVERWLHEQPVEAEMRDAYEDGVDFEELMEAMCAPIGVWDISVAGPWMYEALLA